MTNDITTILADHALWIAGQDVGTRANLSGANLYDAVTDTPVYQFYLGKYNAVATQDYLRVGCAVHSWNEWLTNYNKYGAYASFSDKETQDHIRVIKLFHELLCGELA